MERGKMKVHFSSKTCEWETPQDLFDKLNAHYGPFTLDPCATKENTKVAANYYTKEDDGLRKPWTGRVWMNPPYGRNVTGKWMEKAYRSSQEGAGVVCLVPARTDTKWWHEYAMKGEITYIKGRLKFGGAKSGAPFPSAIVALYPS